MSTYSEMRNSEKDNYREAMGTRRGVPCHVLITERSAQLVRRTQVLMLSPSAQPYPHPFLDATVSVTF